MAASISDFVSRGGKRQRLRIAFRAQELGQPLGRARGSNAGGGSLDGDVEVDTLVELFALGLLSATTVREIAAAAIIVAPRPQMATLAALGTSGRHKNNILRDLTTKLNLNANNLPEPLLVDMPLWTENADGNHNAGVVFRPYPVMLPHEVFAYMFKHYRAEFNKFFLGSSPLASYWDNFAVDDPRLRDHPVRRIDGYTDHAIPLKLHGDGVKVGKARRGRSLDVLSLSSLVGDHGPTWDTRILMVGIVDGAKSSGDLVTESTMAVVWKVIMWSLAVCLDGRWPRCDWNSDPWPEGSWRAGRAGERLCESFVFAMMCLAADLDYLSNYLNLAHFNSDCPCFKCNCDVAGTPWTDLKPFAAWRSSLVTSAQWLLKANKHIIFQSPRVGLTIFHVAIDVLHVLDLGILQHICASALVMILWDGDLIGTFLTRLAALWPRIQQSYDALGTPAGERLSYSLFAGIFETCGRSRKPIQYPDLHSKAAIARHCVPMLKHLLSQLGYESEQFGHLRACLDGLARFYDIIRFEGLIMDQSAAADAHDGLLRAGVHHAALCTFFMDSGRRLFYLTIKAHYAQHIALDMLATKLNPRYMWAYADEDYMGRVARVCAPCMRGRGPLRVGTALMFRWRQVMFLRWQRRAREGLGRH